MYKFKRTKYHLVIIILFIFFYFNFNKLFKDKFYYNDENYNQILKIKDNEISIVVNMKNLTKDKHIFFYEFMRKFNSTRIF
jgi:hypothetical protein